MIIPDRRITLDELVALPDQVVQEAQPNRTVTVNEPRSFSGRLIRKVHCASTNGLSGLNARKRTRDTAAVLLEGVM